MVQTLLNISISARAKECREKKAQTKVLHADDLRSKIKSLIGVFFSRRSLYCMHNEYKQPAKNCDRHATKIDTVHWLAPSNLHENRISL